MSDYGSFVPDAGYCKCGKVCYLSRKDAKLIARKRNIAGVSTYQHGRYWHLGHLPSKVRAGKQGRDQIVRVKRVKLERCSVTWVGYGQCGLSEGHEDAHQFPSFRG